MAYTSGRYHLTNLLQDAYSNLGQYASYPLTGTPSKTSAPVGELAAKDSVKEGTLFCVETTDNEAPEGEYRRITAYAKSSTAGTFTVADFSATLTAADTIAVVNDLYPIYTMESLANRAMSKLGDIVIVDTTTLDSASNKTEYALEIAAKRKLLRVDYQTNTADANDNRWYTLFDVETIPANPGVAGLLILEQLDADRDIRYWYMDVHPRLNTYDDFIDEVINPQLASLALTVAALEWQKARLEDEETTQLLNYYREEFRIAKQELPIQRPPRKSRFITMPRKEKGTYTGVPGLVRL